MKPVVQRRLEFLRAVRFWRPSSCFDRSLHSWQDKELRFPNKETHILASQKGMLSCVTRRQASKDEKNLPPSMARKNTQTRIRETHKTLGEETYPHRKHDGGEHSKWLAPNIIQFSPCAGGGQPEQQTYRHLKVFMFNQETCIFVQP